MPRTTHKLSNAAIAGINRVGRYADGGGLYLQVSRYGTKAWIFRYMRNLKTRSMGLGSLSSVSIDAARERARASRALLAYGVDPLSLSKEGKRMDEVTQSPLQKFLRRQEVVAVTGLPTSTIYEQMSKGLFPKPVRLSPRLVGWLQSDIAKWQQDRIAERDARG